MSIEVRQTTVPRIFLTGPPRAGKTTFIDRLIQELDARKVAVGGFVTYEVHENGERIGFTVREINGPHALLAHVSPTSGPKVGRYRVDVAAFESVALPAVERAIQQSDVAVIDELGQMELCSSAFIRSFERLLVAPIPLVATIQARKHPITDTLKQRSDIELMEVSSAQMDQILNFLLSFQQFQPGI